jgi:hypothetical protein
VNNEIIPFNRKLMKSTKIFEHTTMLRIDYDRKYFTSHGLYLNGLGKEVLAKQLASHVCTILEKQKTPPLSLGWKMDHNIGTSTSVTENNTVDHSNKKIVSKHVIISNQETRVNRTSNRNRKTQVSRTDDFLW